MPEPKRKPMILVQLLFLYVCFRAGSAGYVSVQLPYANPAGVNYVSGQSHYQAGLLAGPTRYSVPQAAHAAYPLQNVQVLGTPSYYSYNLPTTSVSVNPFHGYGYSNVGFSPVSYGAVGRPQVVAVAQPQPVHPVVTTQYHGQGVIPTATVVPVHVPAVTVKPVVTQYHGVPAVTVKPVVPVAPVHPVVTQYHGVPAVPVKPVVQAPVAPVHTTTVTKTVTEESSVTAVTEHPLPVIKSRRYKVRRPAIQNQFYDIEERVIIRPVGSALVELEQPVSRTETSVNTHTVQTQSEGGASAHGQGHTVNIGTTTVTQKPQVIQTHTVYHQTPVAQAPAHAHGQGQTVNIGTTTVTQKPQVIQTHTVYHQTPVAQVPALAPNPVIVHSSTAGHVVPQAFVPQYQPVVPQFQQPIYVNQLQPVYYPTSTYPVPVTTFKPAVVTTPAPTPVIPSSTEPGNVHYDDDSVVIEARSGGRTIHVETSSEAPLEHSTAEGPLKYRKQCDDDQTVDDPPKRGDIAITYATEATHQSLSAYQENSTEQTTTEQPEEDPTTMAQVKGIEITARLALGNENRSQSAQLVASSRSANFNEVTSSTPTVVITNSGSAEQTRTNQEQFIRLLSERDSIAEVGYGPNTDSSSSLINTYVRSRVLSATPAPSNAKETSKTVNIRRIIVSRPIETEQEVEVREQSYPTHGFKRQTTSSSEQVPVYTTAKPPAFADDDNVN